MSASPRRSMPLSVRVATAVVAILLTLGLCECGYRIVLSAPRRAPGVTYRVAPAVYTRFDERHGETQIPGLPCWFTAVNRGSVAWGDVMAQGNADGLGGKAGFAEYGAADLKALAFGDSFTHWCQGGITWPDVLQEGLARRTGRATAVLNYGRGGYGVAQMLELAADRAEEHRPELIVLAPIGDDFTRARWWSREVKEGDRSRWMLSSRKDEFLDPRYASDQVLVDPRATRAWAERMIAGAGTAEDQALLAELNELYVRRRAERAAALGSAFRPLALDRLYLLRRLLYGEDVHARHTYQKPRVEYDDFAADAGVVQSIERIKRTGARVVLIYLPLRSELDAGAWELSAQSVSLLRSVERLFGVRFQTMFQDHAAPVPAKMDMLPKDPHPNEDGLRFYGENAAAICARELAAPAGAPAGTPPK